VAIVNVGEIDYGDDGRSEGGPYDLFVQPSMRYIVNEDGTSIMLFHEIEAIYRKSSRK